MTTTHLRQLLAAATPGPWERDEAETNICGRDGFTVADVPDSVGADPRPEADRALIVGAVNALPTLLDKIERYENALHDIREHGIVDRPPVDNLRACAWNIIAEHCMRIAERAAQDLHDAQVTDPTDYARDLQDGLDLIEGVQVSVPLDGAEIRETDAAMATLRMVLSQAINEMKEKEDNGNPDE